MNGKRLLVIGLLGLFMISMLAGVVSAESHGGNEGFFVTINKFFSVEEGEFFPSIFGDRASGNQGALAKILLIALVVLLVYAISSTLPFLSGEGKDGIRWGFSVIVGVLSFMFVNDETISLILINYEALGVSLTSIIPLLIIVAFTWELRKNGHEAIANIIDKPLYLIFGGYFFIRWIGFGDGKSPLAWLYLFTAIAAVFWSFAEDKVYKKFKTELKKVGKEEKRMILEDATDTAKAFAKAGDDLTKKE